jgi:cytochrome c2
MSRIGLLILTAILACGCDRGVEEAARARTGGDVERGRATIAQYGCASCHSIPGIRGADAHVGPPLDRIAIRSYIGVGLPNTPENLQAWIKHPRQVSPKAAMPDLHLSDGDVRDIACYLYTLK